MKQQKRQEKLEALVLELERELSEGKSHIAALEETHERLRETERICQELADENRRLGEEITGWQKRVAKSEENQRQLSVLRQQLEALQAEHARVLNANTQTQEKLAAHREADKVSSVIDDSGQPAGGQSGDTGSAKADDYLIAPADSAPRTETGKEKNPVKINSVILRNWRIGAASACVIVLVIVGAVKIKKILTKDIRTFKDPIVSMPEGTNAEAVPAPVSRRPTKTASPTRGLFQTVRPTQVFSEPSEASKPVANISKGTKVTVVDSKDGWLEIRSRHGRPPGFIRREATVRIGSD